MQACPHSLMPTLVAAGGTVAACVAAAVLWVGLPGGITGNILAGLLLAAAAAFGAVGLILARRAQVARRDQIRSLCDHVGAVMQRMGRPGSVRTDCRELGLTGISDMLRELDTAVEELIEQRRQREHEVMRADQLAMVGQIAAGFAHEIRNPLTAVKMLVQAGRRDADESPLLAEDLEIIEREIRRMERSLQRFLDFARPPSPERRPLKLRAVVQRVLALIETRAAKQQVAVRFVPMAVPMIVEADEDQIQQLILNLVLNALDVMPSGGMLEITFDSPSGSQLELRVADTGPGIPEELLPRLFDPFISTKETGIGLGLAVSYRIAESHGGALSAENRPGGGACFILRLPCAVPAAAIQ